MTTDAALATALRYRLELVNAKVILGEWLDARPVHNKDEHDERKCKLCGLFRSISGSLKAIDRDSGMF